MGLCQAANKYKPSSNVPFWGFAHRRVHGAVIDSIRRKNFQHTTTHQLEGMDRKENGTVDQDVIEALRIECDPSNELDRAEVADAVCRAVHTLDPITQKVIQLRYGFGQNGKESGETLGVCESVSSQLHRSALRQIRGSAHGRQLKEIQMKNQTPKVVDIEQKRIQLMVDELGQIDGRLNRVKRDISADTARRKEIHKELLARVPKETGAAETVTFHGRAYEAIVSACSNQQVVLVGGYAKILEWMGQAFFTKCKVTLETLKAYLTTAQYEEVISESRTGPRSIECEPIGVKEKRAA